MDLWYVHGGRHPLLCEASEKSAMKKSAEGLERKRDSGGTSVTEGSERSSLAVSDTDLDEDFEGMSGLESALSKLAVTEGSAFTGNGRKQRATGRAEKAPVDADDHRKQQVMGNKHVFDIVERMPSIAELMEV